MWDIASPGKEQGQWHESEGVLSGIWEGIRQWLASPGGGGILFGLLVAAVFIRLFLWPKR
jgi:hypothetical protein